MESLLDGDIADRATGIDVPPSAAMSFWQYPAIDSSDEAINSSR